MTTKSLSMPPPEATVDLVEWPSNQWHRLDTALWCYFFLPVVIFLAGFFTAVVGVSAAFLALLAAAYLLPRAHHLPMRDPGRVQRSAMVSFAGVAVFAAAWSVLGGAGHVFFANSFDWLARFAVLRDLVVQDWPPRYVDALGHDLVLRAPVAYYLPAAWLARHFGLAWADSLLLVWTWLGVTLFFAANFGGTLRRRLAGAVLFATASGLDIVGVSLAGIPPWPGSHLEWWAGSFQYSANTTLLFWVPNHALPGWIAAAWLWRLRNDPRFVARLPVLFLPVALWSPLAAIGLLPLALAATWWHCRSGSMQWMGLFKAMLLVAPAAGLGGAYLLMAAGTIDAGLGTAQQGQTSSDLGSSAWRIGVFFVLEAGLFGMLALKRNSSPLLVTSLIVLAVLPWFRLGPSNDLVMRASIPALTILWLVLIAELTARPAQRALSKNLRDVLVILWLLGIATPFQEIYRALSGESWAADTTRSAPAAMGGFPPHYFAPSQDSALNRLFRN